jgi:hypothetical protein
MPATKYPFDASSADIAADPDSFVNITFGDLQSSFLLLPRSPAFVTYPDFEQGYEILKRQTQGFTVLDEASIMTAIRENAVAFIVLIPMLGFTPPEFAYIAARASTLAISQNYARWLDRQAREDPRLFHNLTPGRLALVTAMVKAAGDLLQQKVREVPEGKIHRLDRADTAAGTESIRHLATEGVPYAMLLYERFLGRPFAGYRDAVSELVGDVMESAVEAQLRSAGISYRKTARAEKIPGFDQAPDFIVPDEWNPRVVIEAKISEDDGTARDKVTRIQHLAELSARRVAAGQPPFEVVACIDGRGFGVRREDMRKLLAPTQGKVFTLKTLDRLADSTGLREYRTL